MHRFFQKKSVFFAKNGNFSGVGIDTQMVQSPCVGRQKFPCFWSYSAFDVYTVLTPKSMVLDPPKYGFSSGEIHGFGGRKSMVFGSPKQFFAMVLTPKIVTKFFVFAYQLFDAWRQAKVDRRRTRIITTLMVQTNMLGPRICMRGPGDLMTFRVKPKHYFY